MLQESPDDRTDADVFGVAGTPGRRQQNPRMMRSIGTPAFDASHRASIMSGSSSWFILAMMRAGCPARLISISR